MTILAANPRRRKSIKRKGASARSRRKGIATRLKRIAEHEAKLAREPESSAARHWRHEIENWWRQIAEEEDKL